MSDPKMKITNEMTEGQVWLSAWCATAAATNCHDSKAATSWADTCLKEYKARFAKVGS